MKVTMPNNNKIRRFDEFTAIPFKHRQSRYKARNLNQHKCPDCGRKPARGAARCLLCRNRKRVIDRKAAAKRYADPEFKAKYLERLRTAYRYYKDLGYNSKDCSRLSRQGINPAIEKCPGYIPQWHQRHKDTIDEVIAQQNSWRYSAWERKIWHLDT